MKRISFIVFLIALSGFIFLGLKLIKHEVRQEAKTEEQKPLETQANSENIVASSKRELKIGEDSIIYFDSIVHSDFVENCDETSLVYFISQNRTKSVFKISIGDFCVTNDKFIVFNDLVISEWIGSAGGGGGLRGLILWKIINGELLPVGGYPNDSEVFGIESLITTTNENNPKQQFSYPLGSMNAYSGYQLKNPLELRYAEMIWKVSEESHSQPHQWYLTSYILSNDGFIRNPNWNNGKAFTTKEKIEGWSDDAEQALSVFYDKYGQIN